MLIKRLHRAVRNYPEYGIRKGEAYFNFGCKKSKIPIVEDWEFSTTNFWRFMKWLRDIFEIDQDNIQGSIDEICFILDALIDEISDISPLGRANVISDRMYTLIECAKEWLEDIEEIEREFINRNGGSNIENANKIKDKIRECFPYV
jgi:hypothetical protein